VQVFTSLVTNGHQIVELDTCSFVPKGSYPPDDENGCDLRVQRAAERAEEAVRQ
jgi:hypothetical protein